MVAVLIVVILFTLYQLSSPDAGLYDILPLPGIYFLEIVFVCFVSVVVIIKEPTPFFPLLSSFP
jgi:hypothetical protein